MGGSATSGFHMQKRKELMKLSIWAKLGVVAALGSLVVAIVVNWDKIGIFFKQSFNK